MTVNHDKTKAVLILNGSFPSWKGNHEIPNVKANAARLREVFVQLVGIPEQNIYQFADKEANFILKNLLVILNSCSGAGSTAIVYYVGHGIPSPQSGLFWATYDTELIGHNEINDYSAIRANEIKNLLETRCHAERKILICDCCYAAEFLSGKQADISAFTKKNVYSIKGTFFMFSSDSNSESTYPHDKKDEPTFFTEALIRALQEGEEPTQEACTIGEVFKKIGDNIEKLRQESKQPIPHPEKRVDGNAENYILYKNPCYQDLAEIELNKILSDPTAVHLLEWMLENRKHSKYITANESLVIYLSETLELYMMLSVPYVIDRVKKVMDWINRSNLWQFDHHKVYALKAALNEAIDFERSVEERDNARRLIR
ncbi:MAG: caspase family protein [Williamsia sp.]|nr:caspase family protein [Williamsia sp.]